MICLLLQPTFGTKIRTPPQDRRPVPLYEKTPPPLHLQQIAEAKSSEEGTVTSLATTTQGSDAAAAATRKQTTRREEAIRSAGVGSDSENEGE